MSTSLHKAEVRYLPLEKVILAVVHATQKLPHYFQAHTIVVLTQLPLQSLLRKADCISINFQVLAYLVVEFAEPSVEENSEKQNMDEKSVRMISL